MAAKVNVLCFAGSTREQSFNKRLIAAGAARVRAAGGEATLVDLRELELPLYDGDLEAGSGLPAGAKRFKEMLKAHQAILISAPEYNSSITGVLKNAIDWASRPEPGEASLVAFTGKVAGLLSASTGALGGLRGLVHLRAILGNIGVIVIPEKFALSKAEEAFGADGSLKDAKHQASVDKVAARVVAVASKLAG